ncbi:hypothetical protein C4580_05300 [Candidatus Woesearchaeota archaeon]|nr:MAG: hypothetical protein C4580_05300 [Candidatus Woesearchaeota archaeon]
MAHQHPTDNPVKHRLTELGNDRLEIAKWKVVFKESFNLQYFYQIFHDFLIEEGWATKDDHDFGETYYVQRDNPNFGKELRIRWRFERKAPGTKSKLFTYTLDIDWYALGIKDTDVVVKGQKVKAQKGELELTVAGALILDKEREWEKSALRPLRNIFINRVLKNQFLMHKREVWESTYKVRDFVTNYFKMPVIFPGEEEFHARRTLE